MAEILFILILAFVSFIVFVKNFTRWKAEDENKTENKNMMLIFLFITVLFTFMGFAMLGDFGSGMGL